MTRYNHKSRIIYLIISLLVITAILIFIYQFWSTALSENISDCGSFGNYIGIALSGISILLIYLTYNEQRKANSIIRFETSFWKIKENIRTLGNNKEYTASIESQIKQHFIGNKKKINSEQFVCLLNYYWLLHTHQENIHFHDYLKQLKNIYFYIVKSSLIPEEDKKEYFSFVFDGIEDNMRFCFLCYLSYTSYSEKKDIISNDLLRNLLLEANKKCEKVAIDLSKSTLINLKYGENEDDYGYDDSGNKAEFYERTLERLGINY